MITQKTIEQIEKECAGDLADFMASLAETHFDGIKDAIENYFVDEGYFVDVEEGLEFYDNQ